MIELLALRNLALRPWRSALLLLGYSLGVAVMIVLLSIGEALLAQARDEKLVGGGDVTVLPQGIDVEVMKTGGLGGLFFSIDHARFIDQQLLAAPRLAGAVAAVAPQIEGKLLYARTLSGREIPVLASGEIPSMSAAVGAAPPVSKGTWSDDGLDVAWRDPEPAQLRNTIDHFHLPPVSARGDSTWAEWHYFNVISPDGNTWAFISFIVAGQVPNGRVRGDVLVTLHTQGGPTRRFVAPAYPSQIRFSTSSADVTLGSASVRVLSDGRYAIHVKGDEDSKNSVPIELNLVVDPSPGAFFPGAALAGSDVVSGYAVPALRAEATGSICILPSRVTTMMGVERPACEEFSHAQAYHDHNWGVWRGVTWEWGAARAGAYTVLYGRVQPSDSVAASQPLFAYIVDSLGFLAIFRPREIQYENSRIIKTASGEIHVPSRATMIAMRGDDTLRIALSIEDATATDTRHPGPLRGDETGAHAAAHPYFIQMKGEAQISGRVGGKPLSGTGRGFFETYR